MSVYQRPGPPKKRVSKFDPAPPIAPIPVAQVAELPKQPTAEDIAHVQALLGKPKTKLFDKTVRDAVKPPKLVLVHSCIQKLNGSERCSSCKAKIPRADAEKLVREGSHKWLTATRDGAPYVLTNSIVSLVPKQAPAQTVRVHGCFDIALGEFKEGRCYCNVHLSVAEANEMIAEGSATWLMVAREVDGIIQTYPVHNAIVLTAEEYAKRKSWIKAMKPGRPVEKFRAALHDVLTVEQILDGLEDPEKFCAAYPKLFSDGFSKPWYRSPFKDQRVNVYRPQSYLIVYLYKCVNWFWDTLLVGQKLGMSRGLFLTEAPYGKGKLVTGGYDSNQLVVVEAAHNRNKNGRRVKPAGNGPDSSNPRGQEARTTQNNSRPDPNYAGLREGSDYETENGEPTAAGKALDPPHDPYRCLKVPEDIPPEIAAELEHDLPSEVLNPDELFDPEAEEEA